MLHCVNHVYFRSSAMNKLCSYGLREYYGYLQVIMLGRKTYIKINPEKALT